jgi:ribosomal protein S18 acetylase RimI-like enzyme
MHRSVTDADLVVRAATRRDLRTTARLHHEYLPDGFFARLGRQFLRGYHGSFLRSPHAVALVVTDADGEAPAGFLVGTLRNRQHYRWVLRNCGPRLTLRFVAALSARPRLAWLFLRTRVGRYVRWVGRYPLQRWGARDGSTTSPPEPPAVEPEVPPTAELDPGSTLGPDPDPPPGPDPDRHPGPGPVSAVDGPRPVAVLTHIAVDGSLRGRGAGRHLVDAFVAEAGRAGAAEIRLVTDVEGGASAFYDRLGWTRVEERRGGDDVLVREFRLPLHGPG